MPRSRNERGPGPSEPPEAARSGCHTRRIAGCRPWRGPPRCANGRRLHTLLITPWFAAAVGIVIAAALAVDGPHTVLSYAPTYPQNCQMRACAHAAPAPGTLASARPGLQLQHSMTVRSPAVAAREPARHPGVIVSYHIVSRARPGFVAVIIMPSRGKPGRWLLRFAFPAAHVDQVRGASWRLSDDGARVTVTGWTSPNAGRRWGRQPPSGARITIFATGTPGTPASCRLNGARCSFG
jgi:hypothetical protein